MTFKGHSRSSAILMTAFYKSINNERRQCMWNSLWRSSKECWGCTRVLWRTRSCRWFW